MAMYKHGKPLPIKQPVQVESPFPIGGPRQPVHDALKSRGFVESGWSDKWWKRADGVEAHVYGTGSRLALYRAVANGTRKETLSDGPMAETLAFIDAKETSVGTSGESGPTPAVAAVSASDTKH